MCTFNCRWTNTSRHTNSYSLCCIQTIDFKTNVGLHTCNPLHDCHIYNICKMKLRHTKFGIVVISATRQSRAHTHTHTNTRTAVNSARALWSAALLIDMWPARMWSWSLPHRGCGHSGLAWEWNRSLNFISWHCSVFMPLLVLWYNVCTERGEHESTPSPAQTPTCTECRPRSTVPARITNSANG